MTDVHGIVYAYHSSPALGDLARSRTNASLPFAGRYRLIDFALSSLSNAGVPARPCGRRQQLQTAAAV